MEFNKYIETQFAKLEPYQKVERLSSMVSISEADRKIGCPKEEDMIARNP